MAKKNSQTAAKSEKKTYRIVKKRSGRWAVTNLKGTYINGEKKVEILAAAGLLKLPKKKETAEAPPSS